MRSRQVRDGVFRMGAVDWENRVFDTVEPSMADRLLRQLEDAPRLDNLVSLHSEQDHSGAIPRVLEKYPEARLIALVDAATIVLATPAVIGGPHPSAVTAACLVNILKPKARFAAILGSRGWRARPAEILTGLMPNLKAELLEPVLCRGRPTEAKLAEVENLAETIATKHAELELVS